MFQQHNSTDSRQQTHEAALVSVCISVYSAEGSPEMDVQDNSCTLESWTLMALVTS